MSRSKIKWWAIYTNLPVNAIVRLPHPRRGDRQDQETFLAPAADKQTRNCDTERWNHHPSQTTLRSKGLNCSKMKWWAIYINLPVNATVRLPHPQSRDSQGQETFLAPSANKQTHNYDTQCSNHHPSLPTLTSKGLSRSIMKWWAIYTNLPVNAIVRLPHPQSGDRQIRETFLAPSTDKQTRNCETECSNHHTSLTILRSKGLNCIKMKWWAISTNLPVNAIVRLPHPRSGDSHGQETFLEPSADKKTSNYETKCSNHHPSLTTLKSKGLSWETFLAPSAETFKNSKAFLNVKTKTISCFAVNVTERSNHSFFLPTWWIAFFRHQYDNGIKLT